MNSATIDRGGFALRTLACAILAVGSQPALAGGGNNGNGGGNGNGNGPNGQEDVLELIGVVRDFTPDHPDFDVVPPQGYGHNMWNVATTLNQDGRPVYVGGGFRVEEDTHDAAGRAICWTLYSSELNDTPPIAGDPDNASVQSPGTFDEWFQDIPGVNMSTLYTVEGARQQDGEYAGMYEIVVPQFYPVDGLLLGNDSDHNNFFTFEIVAEFVYDATAGYQLYCKSDDDTFVFIDGKLVADLGGLNGSPEQWIDVDRLGLVHGEKYRVRIFKADRVDASSHFHLVTDIPLRAILPPTILAMFD